MARLSVCSVKPSNSIATLLRPMVCRPCAMSVVSGSTGWYDPQKEVSRSGAPGDRAAELGRDDAMALSAAGMAVGLVVRDLDRAVVLLDRSLLLNPNLAISWVRSAWVRIFLGQFDLAIEHASRAIRLSPLDPFLVGMQSAIAFAHFCAGRYDQSAAWAEKAVKEQPTFAAALRVLAASSASLGRMDEATEALVAIERDQVPPCIFPSCGSLSVSGAEIFCEVC